MSPSAPNGTMTCHFSLLEYPPLPDHSHLEVITSTFSLTSPESQLRHEYRRVACVEAVSDAITVVAEKFLVDYHVHFRQVRVDIIGHSNGDSSKASVGSIAIGSAPSWVPGRYIDGTPESVAPLNRVRPYLEGGELRLVHCGSAFPRMTPSGPRRLIDIVQETLPWVRIGGVCAVVYPGEFAAAKTGFAGKVTYADEPAQPIALSDFGIPLGSPAPLLPQRELRVKALGDTTSIAVRGDEIERCYSDAIAVRPPAPGQASRMILDHESIIGYLVHDGLLLVVPTTYDKELVRVVRDWPRLCGLLGCSLTQFLVAAES